MKAHFPVTSSNLSATHLGRFLQDKYALGKNVTCRIIKAGVNDTYLVTDDQHKYVFRVYSLNWRTTTEIEEEIRLLNQLKENGISISYPLRDKESCYIQTLRAPEGDRFALLFTHAEGQKQHNVLAETHKRVGELMASIHKVSHNFKLNRVEYTPQQILIDPLKQIEKFLDGGSKEMRFMKSMQQYLLNELVNADTSEMRTGVVHLDIWFDNLNITKQNKVTIFDFDFCGNGWLAFDIAYYVMQLHNVERYEEKNYLPKVKSFMEGYESVVKLSHEEKRLLPVLGISLYYFYLGIQCQCYDHWSNAFLNEDYLKRYINGLVKRYGDIYQLGDEIEA